jgi:hypothetical protein
MLVKAIVPLSYDVTRKPKTEKIDLTKFISSQYPKCLIESYTLKMTNTKGKKVSEQTASTKKEEAQFSLNSKMVGQLDITPSTGGKFTFFVFVKFKDSKTRPIEINLELNPCLAEMVNIKAPSILETNIKINLADVTTEEMMD